jgi:hypothetical protein
MTIWVSKTDPITCNGVVSKESAVHITFQWVRRRLCPRDFISWYHMSSMLCHLHISPFVEIILCSSDDRVRCGIWIFPKHFVLRHLHRLQRVIATIARWSFVVLKNKLKNMIVKFVEARRSVHLRFHELLTNHTSIVTLNSFWNKPSSVGRQWCAIRLKKGFDSRRNIQFSNIIPMFIRTSR